MFREIVIDISRQEINTLFGRLFSTWAIRGIRGGSDCLICQPAWLTMPSIIEYRGYTIVANLRIKEEGALELGYFV